MKVLSHKSKVVQRYHKGMERASNDLFKANQDAIALPHYWAGFEDFKTQRKSGELVIGAYRTIFDLGNLFRGQNITIGKYKTIITWDGNGETNPVDVFFGQVVNGKYIPGRDWVSLALTHVNLGLSFKIGFKFG